MKEGVVVAKESSSRPAETVTKSSPVRDALAVVNPIVTGIYLVHVVAVAVLYGSAIAEWGSLAVPTLGLAILSVVELVAVKSYLDQREDIHVARRDRLASQGGTQRTPSGPYRRAQSGSEDE